MNPTDVWVPDDQATEERDLRMDRSVLQAFRARMERYPLLTKAAEQDLARTFECSACAAASAFADHPGAVAHLVEALASEGAPPAPIIGFIDIQETQMEIARRMVQGDPIAPGEGLLTKREVEDRIVTLKSCVAAALERAERLGPESAPAREAREALAAWLRNTRVETDALSAMRRHSESVAATARGLVARISALLMRLGHAANEEKALAVVASFQTLAQVGRQIPVLNLREQFQTDVGRLRALYEDEGTNLALLDRVLRESEAPLRRAKEARDTFVNSNLRLVLAWVNDHRGFGMEFMDLVQEGTIGLMRAAEKFEWRRGLKFGTYATPWVHRAVFRATAQKGRMIRIPEGVELENTRIQRAYDELTCGGDRASTSAVAQRAGVEPARVETLRHVTQVPVSLSTPLYDEDDSDEMIDRISASGECSPEDRVAATRLSAKIGDLLAQLTPVERDLVTRRFGIGVPEESLDAIGRGHQRSGTWAKAQEMRAMAKLRALAGEDLRAALVG
jgi:RNA polymerase primary sigma factor